MNVCLLWMKCNVIKYIQNVLLVILEMKGPPLLSVCLSIEFYFTCCCFFFLFDFCEWLYWWPVCLSSACTPHNLLFNFWFSMCFETCTRRTQPRYTNRASVISQKCQTIISMKGENELTNYALPNRWNTDTEHIRWWHDDGYETIRYMKRRQIFNRNYWTIEIGIVWIENHGRESQLLIVRPQLKSGAPRLSLSRCLVCANPFHFNFN